MKNGNTAMVYGFVALLSVLLWLGYLMFDKRKNRQFASLFGCVAAANGGYFLLSVCSSLAVARVANGISYFGTAFSMLVMLLIICNVCGFRMKKWTVVTLTAISTAAFLLAAGGDWMGLYYKAISLETRNGTTRLIKEYGPLHSLYAMYLGLYMAIMVAAIAQASKTKRLASPKYTLFLFTAVLLNLGVWLVEQIIHVDFEFLSVSYIATEVLLLLIYGMLCDYGIVHPEAGILSVQLLTQLNTRQVQPHALPPGMEDMFRSFAEKAQTLSSAERRILNYYIDGYETADIPELAFISIHTVKKHNRSIYQKLAVASRDELMLYIELFRCCGRLGELTGEGMEPTPN